MINEEMTGAAAPLPCRGGAGVGSVIFLSFGSAMYLRFNDLLFLGQAKRVASPIYVLFYYFVISPGPISRLNSQIVQL